MESVKKSRKPLLAAYALVVVAVFAIASTIEAVSTQTDLDIWLDAQAAVVEEVIADAVDAAITNLTAVAAFVEEEDAHPAGFERFTSRIASTASAVGIGYIEAVPRSRMDAFVAEQTAIHGDWYRVFEYGEPEGEIPVDLGSRDVFYPVQAFSIGKTVRDYLGDESITGELAVGLDAGYDPAWRDDVARAIQHDGPTMSQYIDIDIGGLKLSRVFFASVPVRNRQGPQNGLVIAMMHEPLLLSGLSSPAIEQVEWEVVPAGATPTRVDSEYTRTYPLELPGNTWTLAVAPTDEAIAELQGFPWWTTGLIAATLVGLTILALWLLLDRRTEHNRALQFRQIADDKDRFLASVSHELRTPLTVVSGLAHELTEEPESFSDEERVELMTMLMDQTEELSAIVEDLLVAARSDIGKVAIHYGEVDLGAEVDSAVHSLDLVTNLRGDPVAAYGDPQRVRQILRNLLTNAKRYGGPEVRVSFSEGTDWVEVTVSDNGDGVPREKRDVIFDPYRSAHRPNSDVRSVGLGLYISRNLARAMGGDLEYVYDGEWSHFRLRLQVFPSSLRSAVAAAPALTATS